MKHNTSITGYCQQIKTQHINFWLLSTGKNTTHELLVTVNRQKHNKTPKKHLLFMHSPKHNAHTYWITSTNKKNRKSSADWHSNKKIQVLVLLLDLSVSLKIGLGHKMWKLKPNWTDHHLTFKCSCLNTAQKRYHLPFITSSACKVYTWKPAVHAKYTPGNQQCRSRLQLKTSCARVLHCRSLPAYFKLLYLLNHPPSLIHRHINLKTTEWNGLFSD